MGQWRLKCTCKEREREGKGRIRKEEMNEGQERKERHARRGKGDIKERVEKEKGREGEREREREYERMREKESSREKNIKNGIPTARGERERERWSTKIDILYYILSFAEDGASLLCEWVECHLLCLKMYRYIICFLCLNRGLLHVFFRVRFWHFLAPSTRFRI